MAKKNNNIVVGLDLGSSKVAAVVAEITETGIDIIGIGKAQSSGIKKGVIINIESTVSSVKKALEEAELMAGCDIESVYVTLSGTHVTSVNSQGVVAIKDKEITRTDIERVIDAAKAVNLPQDKNLIHLICQEFLVDGQNGIKEPIGMAGGRLESKVHLVTATSSVVQNIIKCANKAGVKVNGVVLESIASSEAVLTKDEKDLGVCLIDIGSGTTALSIYYEGSLIHSKIIPLAGNQVTNDIAIGLKAPSIEAENIKIKYGCALSSLIHTGEMIEVTGVGGSASKSVPKKILSEIIEPRMEELLQLVQKEIIKNNCSDLLASGVVITGGTSMLDGLVELGEMVFDVPVKRGIPYHVGGLVDIVKNPIYASSVGLCVYAKEELFKTGYLGSNNGKYKGGLFSRVKTYINEIF